MSSVITNILIVSEEQKICQIFAEIMAVEGYKVLLASNADGAMRAICVEKLDCVLASIKMFSNDSLGILKQIKDLAPNLPVVLIDSLADVRQAVTAIKGGADDYLAMPLDNREVVRVIREAVKNGKLKNRLSTFRTAWEDSKYDNCDLLESMGYSNSVRHLLGDVNHVARSNFTVVITGETGTGKELVARAIHKTSTRADHPFIPVDCGSIPEHLLESELFGHERGSFTGAEVQRRGKFEMAHKGTLFMDEVTNMSLGSQAKFLRVLQERQIFRVGATRSIKIDIRVIAATNQDLQDLAEAKLFRPDLFYRLNEFMIHIPPLRERREDIPYLANRFLEMVNIELGKNISGIADDAMELLLAYQWPGNVRQLRATIRAAALAARNTIEIDNLNLKQSPVRARQIASTSPELSWKNVSLGEMVSQSTTTVERWVIREALRRTGGNKAKAARLLQIDYKTIHSKVKKYEISFDA